MLEYKDLKKIAYVRLREAKALNKAGFYDGAVYLAGYVLEIALKAVICKHLKVQDYPDKENIFSTHNFDRLLLLSGLSEEISAKNKRNKKLFFNWSIVTQWRPEGRYSPVGKYKEKDAKEFLKALDHRHDGVFTFIKRIW